MKNSFQEVAINPNNSKWENTISRILPLSYRNSDIRTEFDRDYTRIIHSNAYKRLKHKTQVFFSPENDHICTRGEHVTHVESISYTIASYLGLNTELTKAIAVAHDLGHSPFGHSGEKILSEISKRDLGSPFWHEKNGLHFVDSIELLEGHDGYKNNLNLTYGIRDGIISHCGEITENALKPRDEFIDLNNYLSPNQYSPYTWEGCVVKISDKISYIGRDIEDAITLGILDNHLQELYDLEGSDKMQILKLLTRLRQLCLEPRLVYDNIDQPSSKLKACMELIKTMQENKQKVLLFSSFTSVLDLIAEECQKAGITYYMLTGSTNKEDRRELVSRFQKDDTTVFLISLKAGGTGLNLTSAEAVIHFDPWWNVSAQNQATDRAYRIGQKNNVQVFNLVMKDSVEEKIIELQKRKKELADMFVENNSGGLSQMSKEDILSLFTM